MNRRTPVAAVALLAVLACAAPSGATTITFQNGVLPDGSYAGCVDNWIYAFYPTTNYGTNTWGNGIGYYSNAVKRSLIKFDVSAIPSTATVTSAKLRLLMYTIGANRTVEAYQVLRPWTQTGSTWNNYATGLAWTTAGCGGVGTDRCRHRGRQRRGHHQPGRDVDRDLPGHQPGAGLGQRHDHQLRRAAEGHLGSHLRNALPRRELHHHHGAPATRHRLHPATARLLPR